LTNCAAPLPTSSELSGEIIKVYRVIRQLAAHQRAVQLILDCANQSVISMTGASNVAVLCNFANGPAFRTVLCNTSLVVASKVRGGAQRTQLGNASVGGQHNIDVDGDLKVVFDPEVSHLYLLNGTMYVDGSFAARTTDQNMVEKVFDRA